MIKTPTFDEFWDAYGLKRDKVAAERSWKRLSAKDRRAAFDGIGAYKDDCQRCQRQMMYAQGYLNHRRWEDEIEATAGNKKMKMNDERLTHGTQRTYPPSAAAMAEQRRQEVRDLSRLATAGATVLSELFNSDKEQ